MACVEFGEKTEKSLKQNCEKIHSDVGIREAAFKSLSRDSNGLASGYVLFLVKFLAQTENCCCVHKKINGDFVV